MHDSYGDFESGVSPDVLDAIAGAFQPGQQERDPGLPIETEALHSIFRDKDKIKRTHELTEKGVAVVQTSTDSKLVRELQEHAAQVSGLAQRGIVAAHEAMMGNMQVIRIKKRE